MSDIIDGCAVCEATRPFTWMITHLNPSVTIYSCEEDIVVNLIGTLGIQLNVAPDMLLEIIREGLDKAAAAHEAEQAAAAKPKARPRKKVAAAPEPVQEVDDDGADQGA